MLSSSTAAAMRPGESSLARSIPQYVVKLVNCAMWCFEKVIRFMTRAAYIIVAIEGKSFCGAAWRSFKMVL